MPPPMQPPTSSGEPTNPADIAREAFRLLAKRRIMPTPDAYRTAYEEIAGIARTSTAEAILADFAAMYTAEQSKLPRNVARLGSRFRQAVDSRDWEAYGNGLRDLLQECRTAAQPAPSPAPSSVPAPSPAAPAAFQPVDQMTALLRDLLYRILSLALPSLLPGPISQAALNDAARSLKEVINKQGILKQSLAEARDAVKKMMMTFIDRMGSLATTTGDFHTKMDRYTLQISKAHDIAALNQILDQVMHDAREIQTQALQSREDLLGARRDMEHAVTRIRELEVQLEQLSELVHEDQLTGSLNRRGLEEVLEREVSRAERSRLPLCIAMLDLDDFKRLNDTYGHTAGDEALIYLVRVVKDTLRTMDIIVRFGDDVFLFVLLVLVLCVVSIIITRLQRELF